jgi:Uma2 family endonuclease
MHDGSGSYFDRVIADAFASGEPAWEVAMLFPAQGEWTETQYLALNGSNRMVELSNGCLEVLPMPNPLHQRIVDYLFSLLKAFVVARGLGEVYFAPLPVRLWEGKFRQPDIMFFRPGRIVDPRAQPDGVDRRADYPCRPCFPSLLTR